MRSIKFLICSALVATTGFAAQAPGRLTLQPQAISIESLATASEETTINLKVTGMT